MNFNSRTHMSFKSLSLVTLLIFCVKCQFLVDEEENSVCGAASCVIISKCPSVLKLVFKVKAGDNGAKRKLLQLQCGFEKNLPKVCCETSWGEKTTKSPNRIFVNSATVVTQLSTESTTVAMKPKIQNVVSNTKEPTPFTTASPTVTTTTTTTTTTNRASETTTLSSSQNFSVLNDPTCGVRTSLSFRITLGTTADSGQFPWVAALMYRNVHGSKVPLCGATLISAQHLLTAAHCDTTTAGFVMSSVVLGHVDLASPVTLPGLEVDIDSVVSHPDFTLNPVSINDIAMVKLVRPVSFTDMIRPICLYQAPGQGRDLVTDTEFTVAGWGRTERARSSSLLLYTHLNQVTTDQCSALYTQSAGAGQLGPLLDLSILESQICAQGENGTDSCSGDSGGPLMSQVDFKWYLTGIVSFGTNQCDSSLPGVYTKVEYFHDWILETLKTI